MSSILKAITEDLVARYPLDGPYYTSYPAVGQWSPEMRSQDYEAALLDLFSQNPDVPLALYLHYPFCPELCTYCCCYVVISRDQEKMNNFSSYLLEEIDLLRSFFEKHGIKPNIKEIHLGGGSPNVMSEEEMVNLVDRLSTLVDISSLDEFALEIDVRTVDLAKVLYFHEQGINRISFGVQDFNPEVQEAVNRVQPTELIERLLTPQVRTLFQGINFDIMWGLPRQDRESFRETIETAIRLNPDRITLLHYGHYPEVYKHQGLMDPAEIARPFDKVQMNVEATERLVEAGYERIGLDHFARRDDQMARWREERRLNRGFIGYPAQTPHLIGLGPSGLSSFGPYYFQNVYGLPEYFKGVSEKRFGTFRGYKLEDTDLVIRREIINHILNYYQLEFSFIEQKFGIQFASYFEKELQALQPLVEDGLLELTDQGLTATPLGEFFLRHICMVFDVFMQKEMAHKPSSRRDSRVVAAAK